MSLNPSRPWLVAFRVQRCCCNLPAALALLIPMALVLYGTALVMWLRRPSER